MSILNPEPTNGRSGGSPVIPDAAMSPSQLSSREPRVEATIQVPQHVDRVALFGAAERNLKMIREALGVNLTARDSTVHIRGDAPNVAAARMVFDKILAACARRHTMSRQEVLDAIAQAGWDARHASDAGQTPAPDMNPEQWAESLTIEAGGRPVRPKTENQRHYLASIASHDLVFGIGPAGTGKTYLAVAAAIQLMRTGRVRKAVLVRPAVEAGEKLGFLPGDQFAKVNPYLRPLFDALEDMLDYNTLKRFMMSDVIEVVPLAFMRGRTLNDSVIILDEAQNTTRGQMQMFLTRMGQRSKMIVTGDATQIDLPTPSESGLIDAARRLRRTPGVAFCTLDRSDVVRHALVQRIIDAYAVTPEDEDHPGSAALREALERGLKHEAGRGAPIG